MMKDIKVNSLSKEEQKQFNKEIMIILEKCSKEEVVMALHKLKKERTHGGREGNLIA